MKYFIFLSLLFVSNFYFIQSGFANCNSLCARTCLMGGTIAPACYAACMPGCMALTRNCFSNDTSIYLQKNNTIIETNIFNIKKNDKVLTIRNGKKILTTIKNIYREEGNFIFYKIQAKNEKGNIRILKVTENHGIIVLNANNGKKSIVLAKSAKKGNLLLTSDGNYIIFNITKEILKEKYSLYTDDGTVLASNIFVTTLCEEDIEEGVSFDGFMEKWRNNHKL